MLKQSTAVTLLLGPFVDETDATPETGLTIASSSVQLAKQGTSGASAKNDSTSCTHVASGIYEAPLNATDTNTLGRLTVICKVTGAMVVRHDFFIVPATLYDTLLAGAGVNGGLPTVNGSNYIAGIQGSVANTLDGLLATIIEDKPNTTVREAFGLILAALVGQTAGMTTATGRINSPDGSEARVVATMDGVGNRGTATLTPPTL